MELKKIIKRHWSTVLFVVFMVLLFIPETGMPIKVFLNRIISFSPSELATEDQQKLASYDWPLQHIDGQAKQLSESKGKVIVINIWATWCPPCVAEMPDLQELYTIYKDQVDFYFVASDNQDKVINFLEKEGYDFPVYFSTGTPPELLRSNSLPTTFIIDKTGNIRIHKVGAASWNNANVKELIDSLL